MNMIIDELVGVAGLEFRKTLNKVLGRPPSDDLITIRTKLNRYDRAIETAYELGDEFKPLAKRGETLKSKFLKSIVKREKYIPRDRILPYWMHP